MATLSEYYRDPNVRRQMVRFLGGDTIDQATAAYITASDQGEVTYEPHPIARFDHFLAEGKDIGRSLWDRRVLLSHFDIDYVNFTFPAEAYIHPRRTFTILHPVVEAARDILGGYGLRPLHLLSGCGHHLIWSIRQGSRAFRRLATLVRLPASLRGRYRQRHTPLGWTVSPALGRAHMGLGLVMEYVAHSVLSHSAPLCGAPVETTATRVGYGSHGSELVSLDISEYADPLHLRTIRVPFSVYLKPQQCRSLFGEQVISQLPRIFLIPLRPLDVETGLATMRSPERARELAATSQVAIPDFSSATESIIDAYLSSELAGFHAWFYSQDHQPPHRWPETYDLVPLDRLPPCGRAALERPCDLLMQPGRIRHLVRLLLSEDWHPRHIAGLIRSKYERDHGWGRYWYHYDATSRADFYTRLFAGLIFAGRDDLVDFNCQSTQEKGYCGGAECTGVLDRFREALLHRRTAHV